MSTVINLFRVTDRLVFVRLFAYSDSEPPASVYVNVVVFRLEFDLVFSVRIAMKNEILEFANL